MGLGQNPLIPNPINPLIPNFYGFGGMPGAGAGLIPGLSPNLLGQMAMMQQVPAAASLASQPGEGDVTPDDDDLEEGEISPPRTPTAVPTFPIKKEKSPDVEAERQREIEKEKEKEKEKEREREKEKEREKREKEKKDEEERKKL